MRILSALAWCGVALVSGPLLAAESAPNPAKAKAAALPLPPGVRVLRDVPYVKNGHERQQLDLYLPAGGKNLPLVVWIHGGGWQNGSKDRTPAQSLLTRGYAVASINYRLSSHAVFPAQLEDCKAAIRWLRTHAREHGFDPDRIGVWGSSAGGHLVALLGVTGDVKEFDRGENAGVSSRVQAVVDFFGPADLLTMGAQSAANSRINHDAPDSPEAKLIGGALQENKAQARRASPITYVSKDDAPMLIVHGDADPLVPLAQSETFLVALKAAGVDASLYVVKGGGHGGFRDPEVDVRVRAFLDRVLAPAAR
ncbi:alpha/beta hydrolase fold domain-containing protein [Horticoccus sp. 23ND18S-11]|uniref:alpha/beta hydrolase fold domain-containing protein n=1 Tax=Horticoccus sp. 23ND18S-11 TaxID=3391832 RepID=UPI0039C917AE